jgi:hypothetical protein
MKIDAVYVVMQAVSEEMSEYIVNYVIYLKCLCIGRGVDNILENNK